MTFMERLHQKQLNMGLEESRTIASREKGNAIEL